MSEWRCELLGPRFLGVNGIEGPVSEQSTLVCGIESSNQRIDRPNRRNPRELG